MEKLLNRILLKCVQGTSFYDDSMDSEHFHVTKRTQLKKYIKLALKSQMIKQNRIW